MVPLSDLLHVGLSWYLLRLCCLEATMVLLAVCHFDAFVV